MNKLKSIVYGIINILALIFFISLPTVVATFSGGEEKVPYAESHEEYVWREGNSAN